jgi:hypothetical protein
VTWTLVDEEEEGEEEMVVSSQEDFGFELEL